MSKCHIVGNHMFWLKWLYMYVYVMEFSYHSVSVVSCSGIFFFAFNNSLNSSVDNDLAVSSRNH